MSNNLRVWWIPQVPMNKTFLVEVSSVSEGVKMMDVLGLYDAFQYENNIKPDYCNSGGLEVYDEESEEWFTWSIEDERLEEVYFDEPQEYLDALKEANLSEI